MGPPSPLLASPPIALASGPLADPSAVGVIIDPSCPLTVASRCTDESRCADTSPASQAATLALTSAQPTIHRALFIVDLPLHTQRERSRLNSCVDPARAQSCWHET
jgi:hypothetical protein